MASHAFADFCSKLDDGAWFEIHALALLRTELPYNPTGKRGDRGVDAYYVDHHEGRCLVVQFSVQETYLSKIRETLNTLSAERTQFDKMIYVSNRDVDHAAVRKLSPLVECKDWKWIHAVLADPRNSHLRNPFRVKYHEVYPMLPTADLDRALQGEDFDMLLSHVHISQVEGYTTISEPRSSHHPPSEFRFRLPDGSVLVAWTRPVPDSFWSETVVSLVSADETSRQVHCFNGFVVSARVVALDGGKYPQVVLMLHSGGSGGFSDCAVLYGPTFEKVSLFNAQGSTCGIADLDGDGLPELVLTGGVFCSTGNAGRLKWPIVMKWAHGEFTDVSTRCTAFYATAVLQEAMADLVWLRSTSQRDDTSEDYWTHMQEVDVLSKLAMVGTMVSGIEPPPGLWLYAVVERAHAAAPLPSPAAVPAAGTLRRLWRKVRRSFVEPTRHRLRGK